MNRFENEIYQFANGIAYPSAGKYHFKRGRAFRFVEEGSLYQLKKFNPVNVRTYVFVAFEKDKTILYNSTNRLPFKTGYYDESVLSEYL